MRSIVNAGLLVNFLNFYLKISLVSFLKDSFSKYIILDWKLFSLSTLKILFNCQLTSIIVKSSVSLIFIPLKDSIFSLSRIYPASNTLEFLSKGLELYQFGKILSILFYFLLDYPLDVYETFQRSFCLPTLSFLFFGLLSVFLISPDLFGFFSCEFSPCGLTCPLSFKFYVLISGGYGWFIFKSVFYSCFWLFFS